MKIKPMKFNPQYVIPRYLIQGMDLAQLDNELRVREQHRTAFASSALVFYLLSAIISVFVYDRGLSEFIYDKELSISSVSLAYLLGIIFTILNLRAWFSGKRIRQEMATR